MYLARYTLEHANWAVAAGRVKPSVAGMLPADVLALLSQGQLAQLAVRCHFAPEGLRAEVLVPCADKAAAAPQQPLAACPDIDWCGDAAGFNALAAALGPHRVWLDARDFHVRGVPCAVAASWLPDWGLFRQLARQFGFTHQINITRRPADVDGQRTLRKHLARLEILAQDEVWPAPWLQGQRQLVERRLASPWLLDELLACPDANACAMLMAGLQPRLLEQGGATLLEGRLQRGSFDELLLTGLGSEHFVDVEPLADAGRCVAEATLLAALGARAPANDASAKAFDAFVSHAVADAAAARRLCAQLEAAGLRCWIAPRDIPAGQHYAEVIDDALRQSRTLVLLMSAAALASPHVLRELERAVHHRARVLPVRLEPVEPQRAFSYLLSGCQWAEAMSPAEERLAVGRLRDGIAAAL